MVYFGISGFPIIATDEIHSLFELDSPLEVDRDGKVPNSKDPGDVVIQFKINFNEDTWEYHYYDALDLLEYIGKMFNFGFMISGSFLVPFFCYKFFGEMGEILRLKQEKEYRDECLAILKEA